MKQAPVGRRSFPALWFCLAAVLAAVSGCATAATVRVMQPVEEDLSRYKRALVVVTALPEVQSQPMFEYVQGRLQSSLIEKLKASGMFQQVLDRPPADVTDGDVEIVATVTSLGKTRPPYAPGAGIDIGIGTGGRGHGTFFGLGLGTVLPAPPEGIGMQVDILTAQTKRRLASVHALARTGDYAQQSEALADKVVRELVGKSR